MLSIVYSAGLFGLDGFPVTVECDASGTSLDEFELVGLPDAAVKEAKERVRSAAGNSGFAFPDCALTVARRARALTWRCFWEFCTPRASCLPKSNFHTDALSVSCRCRVSCAVCAARSVCVWPRVTRA